MYHVQICVFIKSIKYQSKRCERAEVFVRSLSNICESREKLNRRTAWDISPSWATDRGQTWIRLYSRDVIQTSMRPSSTSSHPFSPSCMCNLGMSRIYIDIYTYRDLTHTHTHMWMDLWNKCVRAIRDTWTVAIDAAVSFLTAVMLLKSQKLCALCRRSYSRFWIWLAINFSEMENVYVRFSFYECVRRNFTFYLHQYYFCYKYFYDGIWRRESDFISFF